MADVTIKGEGLNFDLTAISMREYRQFATGSYLEEQDDKTLAKLTGKPAEWFAELSQPDYRRVIQAFFRKASQPLENDPNA